MSNYSKTLVLGSVLAAATMASSAALADVTANIGVTSNYLWRGVTQTANESAVSGGLDYSHESGAYIGTWVSSLGGYQYENDVYLGYAGEASDISYDIGYILYRYPVDKDIEADFSEVQLSVGYGPLTVYAAKTVSTEASGTDKDGTYMSLNLAGDINKDFGYSITFGSYNGDDVKAALGDTYTHTALAISKGDITFAYEDNSLDGPIGDPNIVVSWGQEL